MAVLEPAWLDASAAGADGDLVGPGGEHGAAAEAVFIDVVDASWVAWGGVADSA